MHGDGAGSGADESGNGVSAALRTGAAGGVLGLGAVDLLEAGDGVLDEVYALFERHRRIPARVADVAAERDVRQQRIVSVYLVDRFQKNLDAMHSVLLPNLHRTAQKRK